MSQSERKRTTGRAARLDCCARGLAWRPWRFAAAAAGAAGRASGASSPQATPSAEQFQRLKRGGVDSVRIPIAWGSVAADQGGALDWSSVDTLVDGRRQRRASKCCPSSTGAPAWAVPGGRSRPAARRGAEDAAGQDRRRSAPPGPPSSSWRSPATGPAAPSGPRNPELPEAADPHLADLERAELQVLRRASPTRPNTASWSSSPTRRSRASTRARSSSSAASSPGPRRRTTSGKPPQAYFATDFLEQMYKSDAGDQVEVRRRRPAPLHRPTTSI